MPLSKAVPCAGLAVVFLCLLAQASHLHLTGFEHRSNDEFLYFKSTKEMLHSGNYLSPTFFGEDRFEKPILFYWFILLSFKTFGVSWVAARAVSVGFALLSVWLTWLISRQFFSERISFLSGILLITMPLFFAHTRTAVPDMALNFFIVLGFYALTKFVRTGRRRFSLILFVACGLGFMIKGFPALIPLLALGIYAVWCRDFQLWKKAGWIEGFFIMALIIAPWFLYMIDHHGKAFLDHVMTNEVEHRVINLDTGNLLPRAAGFVVHNFFYYLGILWNNLAPWSLFLIVGLPYLWWKQSKESEERVGLRLLMSCLFAVFFLFVFIAMEQYNVQYLMLLTTPAAILSSYILLLPLEGEGNALELLRVSRKFICLFVFSVGFLLFGFFITFFTQWNQFLIGLAVLGLYVAALVSVTRSRDVIWPPLLLGFLIIFVTSQMSFFAKNRLSVFASLESAAHVINSDKKDDEALIGIGGSIDPKKIWMFFDQRIEQGRLQRLFSESPKAYVAVTAYQLKTEKEDGDIFKAIEEGNSAALPAGNYEIIWKDKIMAKKLALDAGFFQALLKFDRATVEKYILEDIYIIKKT